MIKKIKKLKSGFVILFAVTISAIILAIALGVSNIAFREIKFGTNARGSNDAFFAADTGAECALNNDKPSSNSFVQSGGSGTVQCLGGNITLNGIFPSWNFVVSRLGNSELGCANVTVFKDNITKAPSIITTVTSKGYNIGDSGCLPSNPNRIEREIRVSY